jgi:hypothetical protein
MTPCFIVSPFGVATDSLPGGTHYITDAVRIAPLSDEHKARIVDYLDQQSEESLSRHVRAKSAFIIPYDQIPFLHAIPDARDRETIALQVHRFSLEYFAPISLPMAIFAYDGTNVVSHHFDHSDLRFKVGQEHQLEQNSWEKHVAYLKFIYGSIDKAPAAEIVIGRICRAVRQGPTVDGIIDLAIGLECLVDAKIEIKFQFSLFHSLICTDSLDERAGTFRLLQEFYDVRSATVHGAKLGKSDKRKMKMIHDKWGDMLTLARQNLTYYLALQL